MDLEFEKYCKVDQSPTTVLPTPRYAKHESRSRSRRGRPGSRNDKGSLEAGFREIKFRNYHRSVSCRSLPARNNELSVDSEVLKRGSVCQTSKERKPFKGLERVRERTKIEVSLSGDSPFSFSLLDSICGSDEEEEPLEVDRLPEKCSVESSRESSSVKLDIRENNAVRPAESDSMENSKFKCHQVAGPSCNANILKEKDNRALKSSMSAKLAFPRSPAHLDGYGSKGSPKSRFTSIRKMFDPLTKSKSHRSPLNSKLERSEIRSLDPIVTGKYVTPRISSLCDLSSATTNMECSSDYVKKDSDASVPPCVPAHLHGDLRLEDKHGVPYFELLLAHSEDIFVAKTWKSEDSLNWVYTFHSVQGRKKSNASGSGMKYSNKDSPIVGQMQVSCHLLSEVKDCGAFSDSMVTEFVLYDTMNARKSFAAEESRSVSDVDEVLTTKGVFGLDERFYPGLFQMKAANASEKSSMDYSSPYPWAPADLHPSLESAAIVIQVPFKKRESLKYSSGDTFSRQVQVNLLDLSLAQQTASGATNSTGARVNVVTPMGSHSMPNCESRGPLPLLDRWRLGGGCDCGGWDMACPIVIFASPSTKPKEQHSFLQNDRPFELHVQGAKERTPALTIQLTGKGHYAVDFHAQLSVFQAFAVCVAMLHATEASSRAEQEKHTQCSTLKALVKDEMKILIESVTEKEKVRNPVEDHPSSFMLNPPFSPMSRV